MSIRLFASSVVRTFVIIRNMTRQDCALVGHGMKRKKIVSHNRNRWSNHYKRDMFDGARGSQYGCGMSGGRKRRRKRRRRRSRRRQRGRGQKGGFIGALFGIGARIAASVGTRVAARAAMRIAARAAAKAVARRGAAGIVKSLARRGVSGLAKRALQPGIARKLATKALTAGKKMAVKQLKNAPIRIAEKVMGDARARNEARRRARRRTLPLGR